MDNNIFKQYLTEIEPVETAAEGTESIKGKYKVGETAVDVFVDVKHQPSSKDIVKFKAERKYNFEVIPSKCDEFNASVRENYGVSYSIYGRDNGLYLAKSQVVEPDYPVEMICEEVFGILEETVKLFEKTCVNFMRKYTDQTVEHSLDPELKKGEFEDKVAVVTDDTELTSSFMDSQREVAEKSLKRLADKFSTFVETTDDNVNYFETQTDDGKLRVSLEEGSSDLDVSLSNTVTDTKGYALVSNVKATYPELFVSYDHNVFSISTFVTPDEFLPELEEEAIKALADAFRACDKITVEEKNLGTDSVSSDIRQILSDQMKDLQTREEELDKKEALLAEKEAKIREKADLFEEEKKRQVSVIQEKLLELDQKEKDLNASKKELDSQKEAYEKEKSQYDNQFENMVVELKRMRARAELSGTGTGSSDDVKKLELKIKSMTRSRAAMEGQLKKELQASQEKSRQLMRDIQAKEVEMSEMKNDFKVRANQMFQEERDSYENEIRELKEKASITENDINIDSLKQFLDEKTEFGGSKVQHARDREIISVDHESYLVKIVFGNMLFVDVTKAFRKPVDVKTVSALNNKYMDIKFFINDKKIVTARKYFSRHILKSDLVQIIRDLMSNFE